MRSKPTSVETQFRAKISPAVWSRLPLLALALIAGGGAVAGPAVPVDFRREILPILSSNCFLCHGPDSQTRKADLRLDAKESALRKKEPVIVPGKSGESELVRRVMSTDADEVMPPLKSGKALIGRRAPPSRPLPS